MNAKQDKGDDEMLLNKAFEHGAGWDELAVSVMTMAVFDLDRLRRRGVVDENGAICKSKLGGGRHVDCFYREPDSVRKLLEFFEGGAADEMLKSLGLKVDARRILREKLCADQDVGEWRKRGPMDLPNAPNAVVGNSGGAQ